MAHTGTLRGPAPGHALRAAKDICGPCDSVPERTMTSVAKVLHLAQPLRRFNFSIAVALLNNPPSIPATPPRLARHHCSLSCPASPTLAQHASRRTVPSLAHPRPRIARFRRPSQHPLVPARAPQPSRARLRRHRRSPLRRPQDVSSSLLFFIRPCPTRSFAFEHAFP